MSTVELSGANSTDEDGTIAGYAWSVADSPEGWVAGLDDPASNQTTSAVDNVGTYRFGLVVTDDDGAEAADSVVVTATPSDDIYVELSWTTQSDDDQTDGVGTDLDLHLLHPSGEWNTAPYDVFWDNPQPDWGSPGTEDDPHLVREDPDGAGPEAIAFSNLASGNSYRVGVLYFASNNFGASTARVRIYVFGEEAAALTRSLGQGEFWEVATIDGTSLSIQEVDVLYPGGFP